MMGQISMHGHGLDNCEGCEWGCYYNWKNQQKMCSNTVNRAFPFKTKMDCENFRALYPDYLCEEHSPINPTTTLDTGILTGEVTTTTTTTTTTPVVYDCTHPCMHMPLNAPMPGYPTAAVWACGLNDFHFDYAQQRLGASGCGINASTKSIYSPQGLVATAWGQPANHYTYLATVTLPGMWTATMECPNTTGISYWDLCLEWETPPSGAVLPGGLGYTNPGVMKQVPCVNGRTPCCPNPPCLSQEPDDSYQDLG